MMSSILRSVRPPLNALLFVMAATAATFASAAGEPVAGAYITFEPNPPPANQVFHGVLHRQGHPGSMGFFAEPSGIARHRITADSVDFLFDTGCGFLCPPLPPAVVASPFTLPALSAGPYRVRILSDFGDSPQVLADVAIVVAGGAPPATALPVGGGFGSTLLGLLVVAAGLVMLRSRVSRPV